MLQRNTIYNMPEMIFDFIEKSCYSNTSTIIVIGTQGATKEILSNRTEAGVHVVNGKCDLDEYCLANNIDSISFIYVDSNVDEFNLKDKKILNKTEAIAIHEDDIKFLSNQLNSDWTINPGYNEYTLCKNVKYHNSFIGDNGIWNIKDQNEHFYDETLMKSMYYFFKRRKIKSVVDFGCGPGKYIEYLSKRKFDVEGYDGNPYTPEITNNTCKVLDLSVDFNLDKKFDCVISLEVGEHIPKEFESVYINNLIKHSSRFIILSWAVPGQDGYGHVNCQTNEYIKQILKDNGYTNLHKLENKLRKDSTASWFKNTLMVFGKNEL